MEFNILDSGVLFLLFHRDLVWQDHAAETECPNVNPVTERRKAGSSRTFRLASTFTSDLEIAEKCADNIAVCKIFEGTLTDKHDAQIVVGHVMIAFAYGNESAIDKIKRCIMSNGQQIEDQSHD